MFDVGWGGEERWKSFSLFFPREPEQQTTNMKLTEWQLGILVQKMLLKIIKNDQVH